MLCQICIILFTLKLCKRQFRVLLQVSFSMPVKINELIVERANGPSYTEFKINATQDGQSWAFVINERTGDEVRNTLHYNVNEIKNYQYYEVTSTIIFLFCSFTDV